MFTILKKQASTISILLLVAIFFQSYANMLSTVLIVFCVGTGIVFTSQGNWETKQNNELTNAQFARNTTIDLLGLALTMGVAMWLSTSAAFSVNSAGAGQIWGLLAGMVVGFGAALVVGQVWGRVGDRLRVSL